MQRNTELYLWRSTRNERYETVPSPADSIAELAFCYCLTSFSTTPCLGMFKADDCIIHRQDGLGQT